MMDTPNPQPFRFNNPRQLRVYKRLLRVGEGPASFYRDACLLMEKHGEIESSTHLIAHLLREIESAIRKVMIPLDYEPPNKCENCGNRPGAHKAEIKAIINLYDLQNTKNVDKLWLKLVDPNERIGLAQLAHRKALGSTRRLEKDFTDLWESMQLLLDVLLDKMEVNYLGYISTLDGLLNKTSVSKRDVQTLLQRVPNNNVTLGYFFEKLEDPGWLNPLAKKGFLSNPPKPIVDLENGGTIFPYWPQADFLKKMAQIPGQQERVLDICLAVHTENIRAKSDLLDIALLLPAKMSIQILDRLGEIDSWFMPEKYGKLISHLAQEGYKIEALALARKVLEVRPDPRPPTEYDGHIIPNEPVGRIDRWHYEQIIEQDFPPLVNKAGLEAVKILCDQIETYIKLSDQHRATRSKDDLSEIWRPAIEDHPQNHDYGIRSVLINGVRDASEQLLRENPSQIKALISELESRKLTIFKRLTLHLLRVFPTGAEDEIVRHLLNKAEFTEHDRLTHEYFLLAVTHAHLLNTGQRTQIWDWIRKPPFSKVQKALSKQRDNELKIWQKYHLMPFKDLDPTWSKYFGDLVVTTGEPAFPSLKSWFSGVSVMGPTSSLAQEQIHKMTPNAVIKHLKAWEPVENDPRDTSREGTGRVLTDIIAQNPEKWSKNLHMFGDLDPTYIRAVFAGYRDALKNGQKFSWDPLLDLSDVVLSKPLEIKDRKPSGAFGDDTDWTWCRNALVGVIKEGLQNTSNPVPHALKDQVWRIIKPLTNDTDPTPEQETEYLSSHYEPLMLAINTTRGNALEAAMQYGVWLKNAGNKKVQDKWTLLKDAPELLKVLNDHLDISKDPSLGIRAQYGQKLGSLCWLDKGWLQTNKDKIFPPEHKLQRYFDAAWEPYVTYVQPYSDVFQIISQQYEIAIKELGIHTNGKHRTADPEQRLAHHLALYYWSGVIDLSDDILTKFYNRASVGLKAEVVDFLGRGTEETEVMPQDVIGRLTNFIEARIDFVKNHYVAGAEQEFEGFSWWIASRKFDEQWLLDELTQTLNLGCKLEGQHLVFQWFTDMVSRFPVEVINCSRLITTNDKKGWGVYNWGKELEKTIKSTLEGSNTEARTQAIALVHSLVAQGHIKFKDLLD